MTDVLYRTTAPGRRSRGSDPLIRKAAALFVRETGIPFDLAGKQVRRTERGRPYFADCPFSFSVSHTGDVWACLFTDEGACGLDVQRVDGRDHRRAALRFFRPEEAALADGRFYQIWTRREAFVKMTGAGFFSEYPDLRAASGVFRGTPYWFTEPDLGPNLAACVCLTHPADLKVEEF